MSDGPEVHLPPVGLLRRYLQATGWTRTPLQGGDLDLFTRGGDSVGGEIVLASSDDADAAARTLQALRTLSQLLGRDVFAIAAEVSVFDFDVMRARLPDNMVLRDSVPLRIAEKFLGNLRRFLISSAAAELKGTLVVPDSQKVGLEYANSCRFGHTFHGSFGFTIESPAGPAPELPSGEPPPAPFERRVVERIARGIAIVERASTENNSELLEAGAATGLNLNMLEDFTALVADSSASAVRFDFSLTPAWKPMEGVQLTSQISQSALNIVDRAVSVLRPPNVPSSETIVGHVIVLQTRENPTDLLHEGSREITIEGTSVERGSITIRVRLTPGDYLEAYAAHGDGRSVTVRGQVSRSSRGNILQNPADFRVL